MFSAVVLLAAIAATVTHVTDGQSQQLVITSDNIVNDVCINGVSYPLYNYKAVNKFDKVSMPDTWNSGGTGCITVEATNLNKLSWAGILAYEQSATAPTSLLWQCMPMSEVGGTCCSSCSSAPWDKYPPNRLTTYGVNRHHNKDFKSKVPARVTGWFWTKKIKYPHICCRAQSCGNLCKSCKTAGAGLCDPGQCLFGPSGLPTPTPTSVCNYKCCVELWVGATSSKYTIVNKATDKSTSLSTNHKYLLFWIDVTKCSAMDVFESDDDVAVSSKIGVFDNNPQTAHALIVELDTGAAKYGVFIAVQILDGYGIGCCANNFAYDSYTYGKFCYTGYPVHDQVLAHDPVLEPGYVFNY
jgi:hypothetical protein